MVARQVVWGRPDAVSPAGRVRARSVSGGRPRAGRPGIEILSYGVGVGVAPLVEVDDPVAVAAAWVAVAAGWVAVAAVVAAFVAVASVVAALVAVAAVVAADVAAFVAADVAAFVATVVAAGVEPEDEVPAAPTVGVTQFSGVGDFVAVAVAALVVVAEVGALVAVCVAVGDTDGVGDGVGQTLGVVALVAVVPAAAAVVVVAPLVGVLVASLDEPPQAARTSNAATVRPATSRIVGFGLARVFDRMEFIPSFLTACWARSIDRECRGRSQESPMSIRAGAG
jgi:hypothetical protein